MIYAISEDVGISCIAFIDGKLHIQMKTKTGSMYQESAYWAPYLVDADGRSRIDDAGQVRRGYAMV